MSVKSSADNQLEVYFGTVGKSMVTLFQFVTLDDWSRIARLVPRGERSRHGRALQTQHLYTFGWLMIFC